MADPFDRLLERTMKAGASAAEPCPSADTLAAYVDGVLPTTERQAIERHAADCHACAEHLALLTTLEPASSSAVPPTRTSWRTWTWLVPVAASLVVASVWVSLPREAQVPAPQADRAIALDRPSDASQQAVASPGEPSQSPPPGVAESTTAPVPPTAGGVSSSDRKTSLAVKSAPVSLHVAPSVPGERRDRLAAISAQAPAAPAPAATAVPSDLLKQQSGDLKDKADEEPRQRAEVTNTAAPEAVAGAAPAAPPAAPPAAAAPVGALSAARRPKTEASFELKSAKEAAGAGAGATVAGWDASGRGWQIANGVIQRTSNRGATWQDAHAPALPGASMLVQISAEVCWFAAPSGDVLVHTSDGSWRRSRVPATAEITSMRATSATDAIVTSADQRRFETKDGGLTWVVLRK